MAPAYSALLLIHCALSLYLLLRDPIRAAMQRPGAAADPLALAVGATGTLATGRILWTGSPTSIDWWCPVVAALLLVLSGFRGYRMREQLRAIPDMRDPVRAVRVPPIQTHMIAVMMVVTLWSLHLHGRHPGGAVVLGALLILLGVATQPFVTRLSMRLLWA